MQGIHIKTGTSTTSYSLHKMKFTTAIVLLVSVIGLFQGVQADPEPKPDPYFSQGVRYIHMHNNKF